MVLLQPLIKARVFHVNCGGYFVKVNSKYDIKCSRCEYESNARTIDIDSIEVVKIDDWLF